MKGFLPLAVVLLGALCFARGGHAQQPEASPAQSQQNLGAAQLDALVAPIALYPDALLSEVLTVAAEIPAFSPMKLDIPCISSSPMRGRGSPGEDNRCAPLPAINPPTAPKAEPTATAAARWGVLFRAGDSTDANLDLPIDGAECCF
jgi:Protein of unknown function (DUF3300)